MFVSHDQRFLPRRLVILLLVFIQTPLFAQVQISGSANYYRSFNAHRNQGNEYLGIIGMGTDPDDSTTFFVCKTYTTSNCPSPDQLHVYTHNTALNQWDYEGSIDHTGALDIGCVSVDGDTIAIGRNFATSFGVDGVDIYRRGFNGQWTHEAFLLPADNFPGNQFGASVSLAGDRLAVGAPRDDPDDEIHAWEGKGSVYIYDRANGAWGLTEKVDAADGEQGDDFGASVAVRSTPSGWHLVVGAPDHSTDAGGINLAGAVYAFQNSGGGWQQTDQEVLTTDSFTTGRFGAMGIGFDGQVVAAINSRDLHIFEMNPAGLLNPVGTWAGTDSLSNPIVENRTVVVGDPTGSLNISGGVPNITTIEVDQSLNTTAAIRPAPPVFQPSDWYGDSVAFNGGVILAGAPYFDGAGENAGAIWSDPLGGTAYPSGLIIEGQAAPLARFGQSMDASDQWAVIGIPDSSTECSPNTTGSIRILRLVDGQWVRFKTIEAPIVEISNAFGYAVAIDGNRMAVSMPDYHRIGSSDHFGAVVIYEFDGNDWVYAQVIEGGPIVQGFGRAIAMSGAHLVVGSPDSSSGGQVAVYELTSENRFRFVTGLSSGAVTPGGRFGLVISLRDNTLLIGAPQSDSATGYVSSWEFDVQSATWTGGSQIQSPPLAPGSRFGAAIEQTDTHAIIGLPGNTGLPGQVALYTKTTQGFAPPALISAPPSTTQSGFGAALDSSQNQLVVGHDDPASTQAHFMAFDGNSYQHIQSITIPSGDASAGFGASLAIGSNSIFVGAPNDSFSLGHQSGMVHLYETELRFTVPECDMAMSNDRIQWIEDDTRFSSEWFASALEVDEGYAIVGTPFERYSFVHDGTTINGDNAGKATIYERTGLRTWTPVATFRGGNFDDPIGLTHSDWLGTSVDIEQSTAVAGGPQGRDGALPIASGSFRVYERGPGGWGETGEFFPPIPDTPGGPLIRGFGESVDLDSSGNFLGVGARNSMVGATGTGAGFVYERNGSEWVPSQILVPPTVTFADHVGDSITVEEGWVAIGAADDDSVAFSSGAVHLFRRTGLGNWMFHSTIRSPTTTSSAQFGFALELSRSDLGLTLVVSSPHEANAANGVGAAFVFVLDETAVQWNLIQRIDPEIQTTSVAFGTDLSIDHNTIAIGAPYLHDVPVPPSRWTGGVELFNLDAGAGQFVRRTTIRPEPGQWGTNNGWGNSVGLSGGTVFLGTQLADGEPFDPANMNMNFGAVVAHDIICHPDCPADMNGDGLLDVFDVWAFLAAFNNQDPAADFQNDGIFDIFDVTTFLSAFSAGC